VYDQDRSGTLSKKEWEKVTRWHITRKKDAMVVEGSFYRCDGDGVALLVAACLDVHDLRRQCGHSCFKIFACGERKSVVAGRHPCVACRLSCGLHKACGGWPADL
jgi:hypothetical protein